LANYDGQLQMTLQILTNITHNIWPSLTLYCVLQCNTSHDIIKLVPLHHSNNFYTTASIKSP